jgi:hypothetical protein
MTAKQFRLALSNLDLTQEAAADLLGIGLRTVSGYAGGRSIPAPIAILINLMLGGVSRSSMCLLKRKPGAARKSKLASVALRTASGSRRRSSPSSLSIGSMSLAYAAFGRIIEWCRGSLSL